jgi:hypothetical protein
MSYKPVKRGSGGKFESLTPEIDSVQERWENLLAVCRTRIGECEKARWEYRRGVEERKVIPVDFERRPQQNKPPKKAA